MAKVIEYYVPNKFRKSTRWIPPQERGKVIQFSAVKKKFGIARGDVELSNLIPFLFSRSR